MMEFLANPHHNRDTVRKCVNNSFFWSPPNAAVSTFYILSYGARAMSSTIPVRVLFFASAREAAGGIASASIDVEYPEGANTNALR
jgi:hypothetical protein